MAYRSTVPDNPFFPRPPMPDTLPQRRMLPTLLLLYFYHLAGFALVLGGVVLTSKR